MALSKTMPRLPEFHLAGKGKVDVHRWFPAPKLSRAPKRVAFNQAVSQFRQAEDDGDVCTTLLAVPDKDRTVRTASLPERFHQLADEWSRNTMHISSASDLINDKSYQEIIDLGWDAVKYLLIDLQKNKRFWFPALAAITGIRPFDPSDTNNPQRMADAWIRWGKWKGLI
ncbi:MAG: hypothetical protein WBQ10_19120 [Terriglobales bacterium]